MQSKKLIVIIHGSKTPEPSLSLFKPLFARFYAYFGIEAGPDLWLETLKSAFATTGAEVVVFNWSGGISWFAVHRAARDLQQLLSTRNKDDIVLFGQSLGGAIAERVARDAFLPVRRVISVVTPHSRYIKKLPSHVEHINLYSSSDNYLRFASNILYVGAGATSVPWARNISLPGLRHSDFTCNCEVEVNGTKRRLFDLYMDLVV